MPDASGRLPVVFDRVAAFRVACDRVRRGGGTLGLVPTMGALHEGHLALVREAKRRASTVAVTIFVNPTQFGPNEDLARYPRDLAGDRAACARVGVDLLFAPSEEEMYPRDERTRVTVAHLTEALCGVSRPHHFTGVATVVTKLFAVAGPAIALFGRKDYQQLQVVRRMTRDLLLPVEIVGCPTVREADGLALSSRNSYLTSEERQRAVAIPRGLGRAARAFSSGERHAGRLVRMVEDQLSGARLRPDYVTIADADELSPFAGDATLPERAVLAVAAYAGSTRLIDNLVFSEDPPPRDD
ncbi:MAG: pantoate--beta-alanine ligase [Polyangiaceae bacterium]|nr:pantoate--beta-alanine ligase [Polyangiaceae bacterium]